MILITTCIDCPDLPALEEMIDGSEEITYAEFVKEVDAEHWASLTRQLGYNSRCTIECDYHVRYHRSTYQGKPCVFMVHSAVEFVFQSASPSYAFTGWRG